MVGAWNGVTSKPVIFPRLTRRGSRCTATAPGLSRSFIGPRLGFLRISPMASTYRIKEWNRYFVKSGAMRRGKPPWVSVTTNHSGYGFRSLAAMPGGAEIYAAFIMIVTVVARTDTEDGRLIDDTRIVDAHHLALRTGFPKSLFRKALPILSDIGWLVSCQCPDSVATVTGHKCAYEDEDEDVTKTKTFSVKNDGESETSIEEIYQAYPKKVGKGQALKAVKAALKKIPRAELLVKVVAYAESVADKKGTDDWQFVPHPATWFNGERWGDEIEAKPEPVNMDRFYGPDGELKP